MSDNDESKRETLRRKAEARLGDVHKSIDGLSPDDLKALVHDYRVHQIELELQNEELRTAREEIDESRTRYFDLYDLAPVGYVTVSEKGLILEANLTAATLLGVSRGALVRLPISRFILNEDQDIYYLHSKKLFETREPQEWELRLVKPDGSVFWAHLTATAAQAADGTSVSRMVISDITERKQAEQAEKESEERFRLMFTNAPMPYQSLDEQGNFLDINQTLLNVLGYNREELIGRNFGDILHPDWRDHFKENFPKFKAVGEILGVEFEMVKKDGSTILVYFNGKIQRDAQGRFQRTHCIFQDVTEKKRTEEALRLSEERFKLSMEATKDGLWDWDIQTDQVYYSPGYARMLGYETTDIPGHVNSWLNLIHPDDKDEAFTVKVDCIENRIESFAVEFRMQARDGDWKWIMGRGRAVTRDASGHAVRMIGTHQDITARKKAEEKIRAINEQLQRSNTEKDKLFAIIAHDLRSPMSGLLVSAQMLAEQPDIFSEQEIRFLATELHKNAKNTFALLEDLLQWARLSQGGIRCEPTPCSLNDLMNIQDAGSSGAAFPRWSVGTCGEKIQFLSVRSKKQGKHRLQSKSTRLISIDVPDWPG